MTMKEKKGLLPLLCILARLSAYVCGDLASNKALTNHHYDWHQIENTNITTSNKHNPTEKMGKNHMPIIL